MQQFALLISCLFFFLMSTRLPAQDKNPESAVEAMRKNAFVSSLSLGEYLYAAIDLRYERKVYHLDAKLLRSLFAYAGTGVFATWGSEGNTFHLGAAALTGKKNSHLELKLGAMLVLENRECDNDTGYGGYDCTDIYYLPDFTIGYRYQKPRGRFIFRTAIGFPQRFHFSIGFAL